MKLLQSSSKSLHIYVPGSDRVGKNDVLYERYLRNALKDFTETEVEEIARYLDFKDKAMMGRAKEKDKDAQGNKSDEEESYDSEKSIEEIPLAQVQAMIRGKKTSTPSPHSRRISLGETRTKKVSMSPTMEKRKTRATSMAERAAAEASKE